MFDFAEKTSDMTAIEILNYYRNLYYAEPQVAERGIVANAINDMLGLINRQKAEVERYKRYYYRHEYDKWEKEIKTEAYQEFAKFLIDKSSKGLLRTSDLPDYVKEMVGEK